MYTLRDLEKAIEVISNLGDIPVKVKMPNVDSYYGSLRNVSTIKLDEYDEGYILVVTPEF